YQRLELDVLVQALRPELAPDARLFEATEGRTDVERVHVDAVGARAHPGRDLEAMRDVGGPHRTGQAVVALVGDPDRRVRVAGAQHRQDRAEDLLAGDAHVVGGVGEQRRPHVPAALGGAVLATEHDAGAFAPAGRDVVADPALLSLG